MTFYDDTDNVSTVSIGVGRDPKAQFGLFANGYANAAATLADNLLAREYRFRDYDAYPVVFLYRHAFELSLKNIIIKSAFLKSVKDINVSYSKIYKEHNLLKLARPTAQILRRLFSRDNELEQVTQNILTIADEFEKIDPESHAYRYPTDVNGKWSTLPNQYMSLKAFHATMSQLLGKLEAIDLGMNIETDITKYIYADIIEPILAEEAQLNEHIERPFDDYRG
jgi:hypothetical protein